MGAAAREPAAGAKWGRGGRIGGSVGTMPGHGGGAAALPQLSEQQLMEMMLQLQPWERWQQLFEQQRAQRDGGGQCFAGLTQQQQQGGTSTFNPELCNHLLFQEMRDAQGQAFEQQQQQQPGRLQGPPAQQQADLVQLPLGQEKGPLDPMDWYFEDPLLDGPEHLLEELLAPPGTAAPGQAVPAGSAAAAGPEQQRLAPVPGPLTYRHKEELARLCLKLKVGWPPGCWPGCWRRPAASCARRLGMPLAPGRPA
jgi:hypothetical protein